jgi:hypothetical protein
MPIATLLLVAAQAVAPGTAIEHSEIGCMVAGQFPTIEARVARPDQVAKARTYFHADEDARWYSVEMKPASGALRGVLPKPLASVKRIHYYIEVTDKAAGQNRTPDYAPEVVVEASACSSKGLVAAAAIASKVAVAAPAGAAAGAAAAPAGFAAGSVAVAGGGIGATALIVTAVAVAGGGAAAAVVAKGGGNEDGGDNRGGDSDRLIMVSGTVYSDPCCPAGPVDPNLRAGSRRIAGAAISTSLDSATTTTDGQGVFRLTTQTRCSPSPTAPTGPSFTVRVVAAGCDTMTETRAWGCGDANPGINALNLICR